MCAEIETGLHTNINSNDPTSVQRSEKHTHGEGMKPLSKGHLWDIESVLIQTASASASASLIRTAMQVSFLRRCPLFGGVPYLESPSQRLRVCT